MFYKKKCNKKIIPVLTIIIIIIIIKITIIREIARIMKYLYGKRSFCND